MANYTITDIQLLNHHARFAHIKAAGQPKLIYLMGNLQNIKQVEGVVNAMAGHFDCHIVELPGMGDTTALASHFDMFFMADSLKAYVEYHHIEQFSLCANSYSAGIAIEYAKQYGSRLTAMTLAAPAVYMPAKSVAASIELMATCKKDPVKFVQSYLALLTSDSDKILGQKKIKNAAFRYASRYTENQLDCFIYNTLRVLGYCAQDLDKVTVPTLVLAGELDPFITPDYCETFTATLPNAVCEVVPCVDHLMQVQRPDILAKKLLSFLYRPVNLAA